MTSNHLKMLSAKSTLKFMTMSPLASRFSQPDFVIYKDLENILLNSINGNL